MNNNSTKRKVEYMSRNGRLRLLRFVAQMFIRVGVVACVLYLLLALPAVCSFSGLLLVATDVIGRLSATVGLGAVLLALAEIAEGVTRQE